MSDFNFAPDRWEFWRELPDPDDEQYERDYDVRGDMPAEGRWWKERLNSAAIDLIVEAELGAGSIYDRFYRAFEQVYDQKLQLAECVYSKKKPADQVCYILKKPVLLEYTLLYMPDNRPRVMDYALVSFEAIRRSNEVIDEYFPLSNRDLAQEVRNWPEDEY